ncbi:MAG: hypothetical protein AB1Z55_02845 [Acidimicrobiia bacterium]
MRKPKVVVRRSPWKALAVALVGVPFVFLVVDYVWGVAGLVDAILGWAYGTSEPEPFELREDLLAALIGVVGGGMVLFGLKELVAPRRLLVADTDGIRLPLSGPFGRHTPIGWTQIRDLEESGKWFLLHLSNAGGIPQDPWGGRWDDDRILRLNTWWWDRRPTRVIDQIAELGLPDEARRRQEERLLEESKAHAAAMELISGEAVVADPTADEAPTPLLAFPTGKLGAEETAAPTQSDDGPPDETEDVPADEAPATEPPPDDPAAEAPPPDESPDDRP